MKRYGLGNTISRCLLLGALVVQFCSCSSTKPAQFEYFQGQGVRYPDLVETAVPKVPVIQKGDLLGVVVSAINQESATRINFSNYNSLPSTAGGNGGGTNQPLGFMVDSSGEISLPIIGRQKVEGLTLEVAELLIEGVLEKTIREPTVTIRFLNHKYSVLGEVNQPSAFNLTSDHTTILDALANAGDLTVYAKRDSVMVIRQRGGGREIGKINLLSREAFASPYFYLRNGDVIYVAPLKDKQLPPQPAPAAQQKIPLYLGVLTSLAGMIYLFIRQ